MFVRRLPLAAAAALALASACSGREGGVIAVTPPPRIWMDLDTPRTVDLSPWIAGGRGSLAVASNAELTASSAGLLLTLTPRAGFLGESTMPFEVHDGRRRGAGVLSIRVKEAVVSCSTVFRYSGVAGTVAVAGDWNGFSPAADPMVADGSGGRSLSLTLPAGSHAYQFVIDGALTLDPANPLTMWTGGNELSRVIVPDCTLPRLDLFDVAVGSSSASFSVVFVAGSGGAPVAAPPPLLLDGLPWTAAFDDVTRVLDAHVSGTAAGKHVATITAADSAGGAADAISLPFWLESVPFDWQDAVAYFAFTDRFRNGDPANDAPEAGVQTPANWQGGDWAGISAAIDEGYFDTLGTNVLWISPQIDNPSGSYLGADGRSYAGYHGYWPASPRTPEEHFGDLAALQGLVSTAHAHGIRVLLDAVLNHVHQAHPYFAQHPDWFHPLYVCGFDQPINCWFADYLPDLDYQKLDALDQQVADQKFWIEQSGADGFRVDAVKHFEHVVGRTLRAQLATPYDRGRSHFYMVGETFVGRFTDGGAGTIAPYVSSRELDGQFDFPLYWEILRTVGRHEGSLADLDLVLESEPSAYAPGSLMGTFLGNHDVARFASHANGDIADLYGSGAQAQGWAAPPAQPSATEPYARLRQAFTVLFALPGMPTIYYGDEIGLAGAGDPDNRRFMPWTAVSAEQEATRSRVKLLTALRRSHPELARGSSHQVWVEPDLLVIERSSSTGPVGTTVYSYLAVNRGTADRVITPDVRAPEGRVFTDALSGDSRTVTQSKLSVHVPAGGAALYVRP